MLRSALIPVGFALLAGCVSYEPGPLIDPGAWTEVSADDDPFADRPDAVDCNPGGWGEELPGIFELETDECEYGTFTQPTLLDVGPGATIELLGWHLDLFAEEPTEGHFVVQIGDVVLFEERPEIPGSEEIWSPLLPWPDGAGAVPAGSPAWFHVHNHGVNSWRLAQVDIVDPE